MNELYPFEGQYLDVGNARLHYVDEGQGEPVLMLHGNPTWSFYYRNLLLGLRGTHRAIAADNVGCGLSDKPGDAQYDYTLARRVEDIETLTKHLGIEKDLTLIVHDWGGMIGLLYAVRHPEQIKRLVIMNTSATHLPPGKRFPWPLWLARNSRIAAFLIRRFNLFSRIASHVCCKRAPMPPEIRKAYGMPYNSWQNRIATLRFVQDVPLRPNDPAYPLVTEVEQNIGRLAGKPALICWGMKDFVFDHHFLACFEALLPNAEVHRFDDCGHYVLEDAGEEILPLIQAFLERT